MTQGAICAVGRAAPIYQVRTYTEEQLGAALRRCTVHVLSQARDRYRQRIAGYVVLAWATGIAMGIVLAWGIRG